MPHPNFRLTIPPRRQRYAVPLLLLGLALAPLAACGRWSRGPEPDPGLCFQRTRVIGFSQAGAPRTGWYVAGGEFEEEVGDDRWELLWISGGGLDHWRHADDPGWKKPLISECPGNTPPDRVVLTISGTYADDHQAWVQAIEDTIGVIREKIPTARVILLQPVVGGPEGKPCPRPEGKEVRASHNSTIIEKAIAEVVARRPASASEVRVLAGYVPRLGNCRGFTDGIGHLSKGAARRVGRRIGEYYARLDEACAAGGHRECGKGRMELAGR